MFPTFYLPQNNIPDPYFGNVALLLRGEGADASTTFIDYSPNAATVTKNNNVQMDTARMRNNRPSIKFGASDDWLRVPDAAYFDLATNDFTIEAWCWWDTFPSNDGGLFDYMENFQSWPASSWELYFPTGGGMRWTAWDNVANGHSVAYATDPPTGQWTHIAINRTGRYTRLFYDGVLKGTLDTGGPTTHFQEASVPLYIGGFKLYDQTNTLSGWISECRITIGYGRYPAAFTPPEADFPLL